MAIIKYNLVNSRTPSYITDGGYFYNRTDESLIGIGSGGGTELTKAELVTRHQGMGGKYVAIDSNGLEVVSTLRDKTNAELESDVNAWCTTKGI